MAQRRTVDLLPEIFRTETNKQFLAATLDQITAESNLKRTSGYVGRRVGPGVNPADNYVSEPTKVRADYQLEPAVTFFSPDTNKAIDAITYPGMVDALNLLGADTTRQDRLWQSQYYTWDPFCDLDKFVNYSQYYWLPEGPLSVDVFTGDIPFTDGWEITRGVSAYTFSDVAGDNPTLTLVRGGTYTFTVNQTGTPFWIQAAAGVDGLMPGTNNISSRTVLGVTNNGEDNGTITFNVPLKDAQSFYTSMPLIGQAVGKPAGTVDLLTNLQFNQINNVYLNTFLAEYPTGIDGVTGLEGRTICFLNDTVDPDDGGWLQSTQFDPLPQSSVYNGQPGSYDSLLYSQTTSIPFDTRYSVWQISYTYDSDGNAILTLNSVLGIDHLTKFNVIYGDVYSNTSWYKDATGMFSQIPLLTAALDTLYYQDATDPLLYGRIQLVDQTENNPIDINDIIGAKNYTSPNGVVFTNGLKVQFRGTTNPSNYSNLEYYVEGVGSGPGVDSRVGFIDGEAYFGNWHYYLGQKLTGSVHSEDTFQQYIYDTVEDSLANFGAGYPVGGALPTVPVLGATEGNGIRLLPVTDFVTPETYTISENTPYDSLPYDIGNFDATLNAPVVPDYLTINRASRDRNAWSRSNRWFHKDVIQATADYNNQIAVFNNDFRGKRPIIEFRADIDLWDLGTQAKDPIDVIDFTQTDAFTNVEGQIAYNVDGYGLVAGSRVIFAADLDPDVRDRIYTVEYIDPNDTGTYVIHLVPAVNGEALYDQMVVCLTGNTQQGITFYFDGSNWIRGQQKTSVNQAPLFDIYDSLGRSLGDLDVYPSSTFAGSKLFGYAVGGTAVTDSVLGFALRYLNINNVGDIVFDNYFYTDTFLYVQDNVSVTENISIGFARQYVDRTLFTNLTGWQTAAQQSRSRQVFRFVYDGTPLVLDVEIDEESVFAPLQVFQGTAFVDPSGYIVSMPGDGTTTITLISAPVEGTVIEVQAISNTASSVAFYEVPLNLENNPLNEDAGSFSLGTIRTHYQGICQNLQNLQGSIDGANNTRDLGDILVYGDNIVQHSSPLMLTGSFLRQRQYEVIAAINFNGNEYQKYKARLMNLVADGDFVNSTPTAVLDSVMDQIASTRTSASPFYWTDMVPSSGNYTSTTYTYSVISTPTFSTQQTYDFTSSNYQGLSVYLNGTLLQRGYDYTVDNDSANFTITTDLAVGDTIVVREYSATYGSYVPNTPTKMGLYGAYRPEIYLDETYLTPTMCIRGHDGSITVAYGDYRDDVLLEFETRIFNNLKIVTPVPLSAEDVIPGQFRTTDYTTPEINDILSTSFLSWVGWNKLNYTEQTYYAGDGFTYNYSQSENKLTGGPLLGAWRGIYNYFYDTIYPNTRPWEMLGFSEEPTWWQGYYGPAPYTSGNTVLWQDLAQGLVRDPAGEYLRPEYARPELLDVIPVDTEGNLIAPIDSIVGNFNNNSFRRSWAFGDDGPVENAWRTSSAWPFAVMRLLALTKPAQFFSVFADRDRYVYDANFDQYFWENRYRLDSSNLSPLYGDGTSRASYINWVIDYNRQLGVNSTETLAVFLANTDVRLAWRVAGYTDKKLMKIYTERSTPNSQNASLLLPDESYQILLYKNQPSATTAYSSVIIQKVSDGWQVFGYSAFKPYFEILASIPNGNTLPIEAGGSSARIAVDHSNDVVQVPYGYTFGNRTAVCDFLYSYGLLLQKQGFTFTTQENGYILDWMQMCQEFLYWSNQGWADNSIINLNPSATQVSVTSPGYVVDSLLDPRPENLILNQNRQVLPAKNLVIERIDNTFGAKILSADTINYLNINLTAYEHLIILDNVSIFADLIYQPLTGARQSRILASGWISGDWNGTVNAPGFVLNQPGTIDEWIPNRKYTKGQIVLFKNEYWAASDIIQPSQEFDYTLWLKSDYDQIMEGLLPNAANASDQLAQAYSVYNSNLESEVNLFSYGLIGFRPREYMQNLNISDVSQVQLYQQFLGSKGTLASAEVFSYADLGKESAQYDIYEYWAVNRAQYGATANRNYIELRLDQSQLLANPSLVQVIDPDQSSSADQTVMIQDVWKSSQPLTSPDYLPTTLTPVAPGALPTAGYVNLEDVDFAVPELRQATEAELAAVGSGATVWVAKINPHDWSVYRIQALQNQITSVSDNLDGRALVQFKSPHGLAVADWLVIREFDTAVDGAYKVLSVPTITSVLIDIQFTGQQTSLTGTGIAFTLQTARVAQASDIYHLPYANSLGYGYRAWVDNNGDGKWEVLEKRQVFQLQDTTSLDPSPIGNQGYGSSVAQGFYNLSAMVGAPAYQGSGGVYTYTKASEAAAYTFNYTQKLETTGTASYGASMDMGDQTWGIVGAPNSDSDRGYAAVIYNPSASTEFDQTQLLVGASGDEFSTAVAVSNNERWIYVGAPGNDRVYVYGRVDVEEQFVNYRADGSTSSFNYDNSIVVDTADQLVVILNGIEQIPSTDYTVSGGDVVFSGLTPVENSYIQILRRTRFDAAGGTTTYDLAPLFTATNAYTDNECVSVYVNGVLQRLGIDYTITAGPNVEFGSAPSGSASVAVRAETYYRRVATLNATSYGGTSSSRFGSALAVSTDGITVAIGSPEQDSNTGRVSVVTRAYQNIQVTDANELTYTTIRDLDAANAPIFVSVNGALLTPNDGQNINPQYTIDYGDNSITLEPGIIAVGDIISIATNQFALVQVIEQDIPAGANTTESLFGSALDLCINNCSLYIGAPNDSQNKPQAGSVDYRLNQGRVYGTITSTVANPTLSAGDYLRINNFYVELTGTTVESLAADIVDAAIPNVTATTADGYLVVSVINQDSAVPLAKLEVLPGTGTVFADLGIEPYAYVQTITAPVVQDYAHFGQSVFIGTSALELVVGAPNATAIKPTTFDNETTYFDVASTTFQSGFPNSGVVYTYDFLPAANASILNPGHFAFGQQIFDEAVTTLDQFGYAVNYTTGILLVGSPGYDNFGFTDIGRVAEFDNTERSPAWVTIREQVPVVDIALMNTVFAYDRVTNAAKQYFDFFDPLQGKLLGAVQQNIDYIGAIDPAAYNAGPLNNFGQRWAQSRVGQIWWDTSTVRFIDPNQDDITYASRRWGQIFPNTTVDIYQWVASSTPPAQYQGEGTPRDTESYSVTSAINEQGLFVTTYYFWVKDIRTVDRAARKTLSTQTLTQYIEAPASSGIAYIAPINGSTVAIYNGLDTIQAQDTILHIEYDRELNDDAVHVEFQLIPQDRADGFLDAALYRKWLDSFCGQDTAGNPVPGYEVPISEKYGVNFRPRQSMFVNRFLALENYLTEANAVMAQYPIAELREYPILNSSAPEPAYSTGKWNQLLANYTELSYQNLFSVDLGYKYLVQSDETNGGRWTIYEVVAGTLPGERELLLVEVQNYDTRLYWSYINWYSADYSSASPIVAEVTNYADLESLSVSVGSSVKVTNNTRGKYEIYRLDTTGWTRTVLEDGTIAISEEIWNYAAGRYGFDSEVFDAQYFDQEPVIETRQILKSLNEEIFIEELAIERNRLMVLTFNYILTEQEAPLWLTKTSLIDVDHRVRELLPYPVYRADNQDFVLNYIKEVKPYHTQIRQFNLIYTGSDVYEGSVTDFDVPAYWDSAQNMFISPILDDNANAPLSTTSSVSSDSDVWQTFPWNQWYENYALVLESITVVDGGSGYTVAPEVQIGTAWEAETVYTQGQQFYAGTKLYTVLIGGTSGTTAPTFSSGTDTNGTLSLAYAGVAAEATAVVTSAGELYSVTVVEPGSGYITTPTVTIIGGNGTGARATPVMLNNLVRSITTTIKYDRYEYTSNVSTWTANVAYITGDQVRYANVVWSADGNVSSAEFDPDDWTIVPAGDLSGINRTQGYYNPTVNMPGLDLALVINGIDYPGVQVDAPDFDANSGYDVGNFDIYPFDNLIIGPEGLPTYDPSILDAEYSSSFLDTYLGTRVTDINVDGGAFVDTYSSHAPEELVPGAIFDTLDLRVYASPGADWNSNGHGYPQSSITYEYDSSDLSWTGLLANPFVVQVFNITTGLRLVHEIDYTIDWAAETVTILDNVSAGQYVEVQVTGLGGGNQLYLNNFVGDGGNTTVVTVDYNLIEEMVVFIDGAETSAYTYEPYYDAVGVTTPFSSTSGTALFVNNTAGVVLGSLVSNPAFTSGQTVTAIVDDVQVTISAAADSTPTGNIEFLPYSYTTLVTFDDAIANTHRVSIGALGNGVTTTHSWSTLITEDYVTGNVLTFSLTAAQTQGTNPINMTVDVDGRRAHPPAGVEYVSDGSTTEFELPTTTGANLANVVVGNVSVYVDNEPLSGAAWSLNAYGANTRTISLDAPAGNGNVIIVALDSEADYVVSGGNIIWKSDAEIVPSLGDVVSVTTYNDTSEQGLITRVFQGPTTEGVFVGQGFDTGAVANSSGSFDYAGIYSSSGNVVVEAGYINEGVVYTIYVPGDTDWTAFGAGSNAAFTTFTATANGNVLTSGTGNALTYGYSRSSSSDAYDFELDSFDYSGNVPVQTNNFDIGREIISPDRLTVTLQGYYLSNNDGYTVSGNVVTILGPTITAAETVAITACTESVVPGSEAFRVFQDMRGTQVLYRISPETTTYLAQALTATADVIYVDDATKLSEPNLENGIWGQITINGERIFYRERNTSANTVSSLLRGVMGTAAASHIVDTPVYDIGIGNRIPNEYQWINNIANANADGSTTTFTTTLVDEATSGSVLVYVGGNLQTNGYTVNSLDPVEVEFDTAPESGVLITIVVSTGQVLYNLDTPEISLQKTDTLGARFIRGE